MDSEIVVLPADAILTRIDSLQNLIKALESKIGSGGIPSSSDRLVGKKKAAELLGCSVSTIDNMRRSGMLTRVNVGRNAARFRMSEIQSLMENKKGQL